MPSRVDLVVKYTDGAEEAYNTFSYYSIAGFSSTPILTAAANDFAARVLPEWADFLPSQISFESITARSPSLPFPVVLATPLAGSLTLSVDDYCAPDIVLLLKKNISGNTDGDTGGNYTGLRPVRGGRVFLSWLPESFMSSTGFVLPGGAPGTAWTNFVDELNDPTIWSGANYFPVVAGDPLPASGSLPARPTPVMGNIVSFTPRKFTRLSTRDD